MSEGNQSVTSYSISQDLIRQRLLAAAWFLIAYELLRGDIVDRVKQYFCAGHTMEGLTYDPAYDRDVVALDKRFLYRASLLWLETQSVLSASDVESALAIREHRNSLAHYLPGLVMQRDGHTERGIQEETVRLIVKLGRHWARTKFPFYPFDPAGPDTPAEEVYSSTMLIVGMFASIAGLPPFADGALVDMIQRPVE